MNVAQLIARGAHRLDAAGVCFGHGTDNSRDEAAWIVFHTLGLDHARAEEVAGQAVASADVARVEVLLERRINERLPTAYLLGEAWFAGLRFAVDQRVLIPRSPFAELILARFEPWLDHAPARILEIGTGSGCMAIACALVFPDSEIVATDISPEALAVAGENRRRHGLEDRLTLLQADLFSGISGRFDLIISNPPYVPEEEIAEFPPEYLHEPRLALASGQDGLETPARILQHARSHLSATGLLALEVGAGAAALEARFPQLPFLWPEFACGGDGIALLQAEELRMPGDPMQEDHVR